MEKTEKYIYTLTLVLIILEILGALFHAMSWPGAYVLIGAGMLGSIIFVILLLRTGIRLIKVKNLNSIYNFLLAGCIIALLVSAILVALSNKIINGIYLDSLILAIVLTMILKPVKLKELESRILKVYWILPGLHVIDKAIDLFQ